jgi:autotransporter-associated beta strand protein
VTISVNAISGGGANPISSVTVNAGVIGGSPTLQLSSSGGNAYTNSVIVAPATVPASYELVFTAIDNVPDTNNGSISLTINTSAEVWNGSASPDNTWSNGANWLSTLPPGTGDPLTFAGVANTTPNMESSYSIGSLTFSNNASPFNITNDGTHTLTLTGGVTNNSAGVQSLSVPVALSGVQTFNAALGSLVFSNPISGSGGGVIAAGTTNIFAGTNTYTGTTAISNSSVLIIGGAGVLGGGFYSAGITDNGTFNYGSTSIQTNSGIISGTGGLTVSAGTLTIGPGLATIGAYTYTGPTLVTNATLNLNFDNQPQTGIYLSSGLTINNGGVVAALGSSAVEGYTAVASNLPVTINVGGMLTVPNTVSGFSAHLYGVLNLNGGTLALAGAINAQYAGWSLNNTVNVNGGINTSYISDMNCIPDQTGGSIFNVTNGGTASGIDLDVVGQLDSTYGSIDTGVILTGNGTMRLNNLNTYSNFTTISNGTFILNGELGSLAAGGPNYPKAILNNGTFIYTTNVTQTLSGVISGTGTLKVNAAGGVLVLSNANTYTGNTIITNGTLRLTNNASINNSSNIVVSGGGMFDVSALSSSFNLGSSLGSFQTLSNDTSMAIIKGNANTRSGTVALTYSVAGTPSFSVTNGILNLTNVTTFNVNNATGSALTPGSYKIISRLTGGSVAVTNALPAVTVGGSGILAGASAALQITSGELYLVVTVTTSSVLTTSGSPTTYGTPVTFTNTITPSGGTISNGYPVVFKDGAAIMGTNTTTSGVATFTTTSTQLAAAVHSSITAVFAGDGIYLASTGSVSQTVQQAPLTPTVSFNSKNYDGTTNAPAVSGYGVSGTVYSPDVVNASGGTVLPYAGKDVTGSPYTIIITNLGLTAGAGTNYALTTTSATNTSSINATNITVTAQPNTKPYDGTTNASTLPVTSFVALGDTASFTEAYTDPNVGTGKTLIPSGTISPAADYNVTAFNNSANGVITALTLTVTNVAVLDHLYDGTTNATLVLTNAGLVGVVNSDNVNLLSNTAAGYFTNKNIGTNLAVFTTLSLTGDATTNNYNLFQPTNVTGNIIATNITVSSQANTKPYDGTTNAAAAPSVTFVAVGDTTNFVEGYFGTGVGTNLALNPSGYVGDGNGGSNYVVTLVTNNVGEIDPTNITVTAGTNIKPYDGTTGATNTPAITSGFLQGSDTGTAVLAEAYVSPNVALSGKALAPSITIADYTNYNVTLVTNNTGVITPLTLTVTNASALNRPYDGTTNATLVLANSGLVGVVNSDNVNLLSNTAAAYFTNKDVGTNLVVVTTLSLIGDATTNNYNLFQPTNITANISSTNIIVRASDNTKNYDSTTNALATPSVSFVAAGDAPSFTEAYADANAGIGKTLTPFGTIAPAADYTVTFSNDLNGVIVPTNITVTAGTNIKPYDGTTGATNTPTIGPGALQGSDTAVLAELYADPNAGTGKLLIPSVVISDYTNYNVTMVTNFTGVITPIATTLTVTSSANPSGYHDGVVFTATNLPAGAVSNVVFLAGGTAFSTNGLGGGYATSLTITNLPRGTNEITAQYLGDGNYLPSTNDLPVGQVVTNHPPVAGASFTIGAVIGTPVTVQIVGGKNPPTDADGDTLAITVSTAAHGTVTTDGSTNVTYTATNGVTDSFTYTVDDGNGGTASQTVNVNISAAGGGNNVAITRIPGFAILNFASVPNTTNVVQLTTNLAYPIIWTPIWTNVAGTNGLWQFIVTNPPLPSAYFRSMRQP